MEAVQAELAFTPPDDVSPDSERPGLLRARTHVDATGKSPPGDRRRCRVADWSAPGAEVPELFCHGFEAIDLRAREGLVPLLERIRDAGQVGAEEAREVRRRLAKATFALRDGSRIRLLLVAPEGFIMRKAGPNGLVVGGPMTPMNDHDAARNVHADQDILGTPLRQLARGAAPWLFRHDAPDSRNRRSPLLLLNLWLPLRQITRPLALMDVRTLDRPAHQLRYALPTDAFLDRDEDRRVNDIWTFLHDPGQRWHFHSDLPLGSAYVFDTLGTPHGSFVVPGEEHAERGHRQLEAACAAIEARDEDALRRAAEAPRVRGEEIGTDALRRAVAEMEALLSAARAQAAVLCAGGEPARDWCARARRAMEPVVRKSLELRAVAVRVPGLGRRARRVPA